MRDTRCFFFSIWLTTFQVSPDHSSIDVFIKDSDFEKDQKEIYRSKPQLSNSLLVDEIGVIIMIIFGRRGVKW